MKKFLRFIGILVLIVLLGVIVLGLIAPKDIAMERSVTINAPKPVVENYMFQYKNFDKWSPWQEMDSNMTTEIIGPERTAGTKYSWAGNDKVGSGEMVVKSAKDGELEYTMNFKEPMESTAEGYWRVEDAGNNTSKAIWGFTTHIGFPFNGIMMVMGMKKYLEEDFDKGLNKLKAYAESHAHDAVSEFKIETIQFPATQYAGIRKTINVSDMEAMTQFFTESYKALGAAAGKRISGPASGLYFTWDEKTMTSDMAAAFPVSGNEPVQGATMNKVEPAKGYKIVYTGGYSGSAKAHEAIGKHIAASGQTQTLTIEEYIKGPGEEKDSTQWVTNIIYLVK